MNFFNGREFMNLFFNCHLFEHESTCSKLKDFAAFSAWPKKASVLYTYLNNFVAKVFLSILEMRLFLFIITLQFEFTLILGDLDHHKIYCPPTYNKIGGIVGKCFHLSDDYVGDVDDALQYCNEWRYEKWLLL